ncbi:hypothetical protein Zmor_013724 [Zophobas morio]|uniref:Gustatory receptor n=1 Tax=Zophobas morio TaxID=2755281 RepID=A0AA38MEZ4_9CUCU|nr:hypothetical protein Zmor_013724 [Zophobas morio]
MVLNAKRSDNTALLVLFIFNSMTFLSHVTFIRLAKEWPSLMESWNFVEKRMQYGRIRVNVRRKCKFIAIVFVLVRTVHLITRQLYYITTISKSASTLTEGLKYYFNKVFLYSYIFRIFGYDPYRAVIVLIVSYVSAFGYLFVDIVIILICLSFSLRLIQLKSKIKLLIKDKIRNKVLWKSLRTEHFYLCKLCASINDKLGNLILLSYATNLYLIIIDWFGAARIERSFLKKAHYSMSIIIDTSKLIAVSWYAASVHEENNNVFKCLLSIPSFLYNLEIERFTNQAIFMKCVISGKKLFTITRGTIFKIAGALVTYELVVLQFNTKLIPNYDDEIHYSGTGFNNSFHQSAG